VGLSKICDRSTLKNAIGVMAQSKRSIRLERIVCLEMGTLMEETLQANENQRLKFRGPGKGRNNRKQAARKAVKTVSYRSCRCSRQLEVLPIVKSA
jgi:hypothetical protein